MSFGGLFTSARILCGGCINTLIHRRNNDVWRIVLKTLRLRLWMLPWDQFF